MHGALAVTRILLVLDPSAPQDWRAEAEAALRADREVELVVPDAAGAARVRERETAALSAAHACASEARARYVRSELVEMATDAARCEAEHAAALATPEGRPVLVDLLLARGLAAHGHGDEPAARAAFARAVATDPDARLDANLFPPGTTVAFAEARRTVESSPRAEVVIRTDPAGAAVTVDGRRLGPSPVAVLLHPTDHLVRADLPGHRPLVAQLDLLGMGTVFALDALDGSEAQDDAASWLASPEVGAVPALRAAAHALGAGAVLVIVRDAANGRAVGTIYRMPSGSDSRSAGRGESVGDVARLLLHPPVALPPVRPPDPEDDLGILGTWWFWTAAGAFAVGTIALAVVPNLDEGPRREYRYALVFGSPE